MNKICFFMLTLAASVASHAGTVRLFNDSGYKLRAVVRGADGSYLGEMVITPQSSATWTDSLQHYGHNDEASTSLKNATRSQTPYTIVWYCMDGSDFSVSDNISTGAFTQAQQGTGKKSCGGRQPSDTFKNSQQEYIMPDEQPSGG